VTEVVDTMGMISGFAGKIVDITAVIDGIAFQTNLLALITDSARQIESGNRKAHAAGATMQDMAGSAGRVTGILGKVGQASAEQEAGLVDIGAAVVDMDALTQENVQLVKQAAQAASEITEQAHVLAALVGWFRLERDATSKHAARAFVDADNPTSLLTIVDGQRSTGSDSVSPIVT